MRGARKTPGTAPTVAEGKENGSATDPDLTLTPLPKQARPDGRFGGKPHKTLHRSPQGYVLVSWPSARCRWVGAAFPEAHRIARELQENDGLPIDWEGAE